MYFLALAYVEWREEEVYIYIYISIDKLRQEFRAPSGPRGAPGAPSQKEVIRMFSRRLSLTSKIS